MCLEVFRVPAKVKKITVCLFASAFLYLLFVVPLSAQPALKVAATISPLADIAEQITGEEVFAILPSGTDPHVFELTVKAVKQLNEVRVIFVIGHGLDDWVGRIVETAPETRLVVVDQGISLLDAPHVNPHYWLSVKNAKIIAANIARALSEIDPERAGEYEGRLGRYLIQLGELDEKIKTLFSGLSDRNMITFHDGWGYFASDYGFEILGSVEACLDQGPTPKRLAELFETARSGNIKVLFSEPAVPKEMAESVARDGRFKLYQLDPIGRPGQSYVDLILENARTIHKALNGG